MLHHAAPSMHTATPYDAQGEVLADYVRSVEEKSKAMEQDGTALPLMVKFGLSGASGTRTSRDAGSGSSINADENHADAEAEECEDPAATPEL